MLFKKITYTNHTTNDFWIKLGYSAFCILLVSAILFFTLPGKAEEAQTRDNSLPQSPDTGTPEDDFSAGGTRDNHLLDNICGINSQKIVYLLGNENREYTLSAYPTFWFHIPHDINSEAKIEFALKELETDKEIYNQIVPAKSKSAIKGIALPKDKINALSFNTNYVWSLEVSCPQTEPEALITLSGWLSRLPITPQIKNQLAATPTLEKYQVYLKNEVLYDALSELANYRIVEPNNIQIANAWNQLLTELGWQDLIQQNNVKEPEILDTKILVNSQNK